MIPHNLKIDDPEIFSGDVAPGASVDLTLNLPAGAYEYYCTIPGHRPAGMNPTGTVAALAYLASDGLVNEYVDNPDEIIGSA